MCVCSCGFKFVCEYVYMLIYIYNMGALNLIYMTWMA